MILTSKPVILNSTLCLLCRKDYQTNRPKIQIRARNRMMVKTYFSKLHKQRLRPQEQIWTKSRITWNLQKLSYRNGSHQLTPIRIVALFLLFLLLICANLTSASTILKPSYINDNVSTAGCKNTGNIILHISTFTAHNFNQDFSFVLYKGVNKATITCVFTIEHVFVQGAFQPK